MRPSRAAGPAFAASCLVLLLAPACGNDTDGSAANGPGNVAGTAGTGGPDLGNVAGEGSGSGSPGDVDEECAGDLIEAKREPLDMYVMLDSSASMLEPTELDPNTLKWDAVTSALSAFVKDPTSAGIGMGLQNFPLKHPDAPSECTSDEECGNDFGPCFLKVCWPPGDALQPCQDALGCDVFNQDCITFGVCENDDRYVCSPGTPCGVDGAVDLGDCVTAPPSACMLPSDCHSERYAAPAAAIGDLPAAAPALIAAIEAIEPDGPTPTGPALTGAVEHAAAWAAAHAGRQVVAVLATDGIPTLREGGTKVSSCEPITQQSADSDVDAVVKVAADAHAASPAISTFVIGVLGPADLGGSQILNAIAEAGGTSQAFIVDTQADVASQFRDALNQIRASRLSCDLLVPQAEAGKTVDYDYVNVVLDDGSGPPATIDYVTDESRCDATTGGWYFDKDPDAGAVPEHILVCPSTCSQFGAVDTGSVQIKLGCQRREPVK
jgi:hypothetical protein